MNLFLWIPLLACVQLEEQERGYCMLRMLIFVDIFNQHYGRFTLYKCAKQFWCSYVHDMIRSIQLMNYIIFNRPFTIHIHFQEVDPLTRNIQIKSITKKINANPLFELISFDWLVKVLLGKESSFNVLQQIFWLTD